MSKASPQSPRTYDLLNLQPAQLRSRVASAAPAAEPSTAYYFQTPVESALSVTPAVPGYRPEVVLRHGLVGDNATDDAPGAQIAQNVDAGVYPRLTYRFRPTNSSPFDFANQTNDVYRAVKLDRSGYTIDGFGATVHIVSRTGIAGSSDIQYAFATDKHASVGTLTDVRFVGLAFDAENDADAVNSNHRAIYPTGVRGLSYLMTEGRSSGARRGYFSHIQNCRNVRVLGHYHYKNTGGLNIRYTDNVAIVGGVWEDFSECIDFDGTSNRAVIVGNCFSSSNRVNQMLDINGQVEAVVMGATAYSLGNVATIQFKDTTPPNYADYVANAPVSSMTPSQRVILNGIAGSAIGTTGAASLLVGNDWVGIPHDGYPCVSDVFLCNIALSDTSWITVYEATRLVMDNVSLTGVLTPASNYAVNITSQTGTDAKQEWSDLDVAIRNLFINGCDRGGLKINNARRASIIGAHVTGINGLGGADFALQMASLEVRGAQVTVDHGDFDGDVNFSGSLAAIAAWAGSTAYKKSKVVSNGGKYYRCLTTGTSAGAGGPSGITSPITDGTVTWEYLSEPFRIIWGLHNRVRGQLVFSNDAHKFIHGRSLSVRIGDLAATGTVGATLYVAHRKCRIARAQVTVSADIAADGTNFRTIAIKSRRSASDTTISSLNTTAGLTAHTVVDAGFAASEPGAELEAGDTLFADVSATAAGKAITGLVVSFEVLDL